MGAAGTRGHSLNIYNTRTGSWHQTWVDSQGTLLQIDGGLVDGKTWTELFFGTYQK